ncbi:MAG: aspartate--tRNA ligase [Clostridia bacterium]|nr:aspartate--tRNA ligase [Clostridia bacterium]
MQTTYRSQYCNDVTASFEGKIVKVCGWVSTIRDHGGITFIDLRDQSGIVQIVVEDDSKLKGVTRESVISVEGKVVSRGEGNINPKLATGAIEIVADSVTLLGPVTQPLPFEVDESKKIREDVRTKFRFLDLRNPDVFNNILFRSKVNSWMRAKMESLGFVEIATPILTADSPEGARAFLVPARQHPGKFYALPQAPQMFKQLLMVGGFDRYFQIAPCFRDEDARADRAAGEFYQLDMEMSFATQEDMFELGDSVFYELFKTFGKKEVSQAPFRRIPFKESMERFGTDKPDLRNPLEVVNVTDVFANTGFNAFKNSTVKAIAVHDIAGKPRSFYDGLTNKMIEAGSKGLAWIKVEENNEFNSPIAKFLTDEEKAQLIEKMGVREGSSIFLLAGKPALTTKLSGILRNLLGDELELCDPNKFEFCWITDFPMFDLDDEGEIQFCHNPFNKPNMSCENLTKENALELTANQFDLVCNGIELLSGAERNNDASVMLKLMQIVGLSEEDCLDRFGALYNAFQYGAPPHAGMALGIDRSIMLMLDEPNVREVIAFPLNKSAYDPLMNAPSVVSDKQLRELSIKVDIKENK